MSMRTLCIPVSTNKTALRDIAEIVSKVTLPINDPYSRNLIRLVTIITNNRNKCLWST
jgi:hypothetical protein